MRRSASGRGDAMVFANSYCGCYKLSRSTGSMTNHMHIFKDLLIVHRDLWKFLIQATLCVGCCLHYTFILIIILWRHMGGYKHVQTLRLWWMQMASSITTWVLSVCLLACWSFCAENELISVKHWAPWCSGIFCALWQEGCRFDSSSNHGVLMLDKLLTHNYAEASIWFENWGVLF